MPLPFQQLRRLFQIWTVLFGLGALAFFLFPQSIIHQLNQSTQWLSFLTPLAETESPFWLATSVSLMVLLTFLSSRVVRDPMASFTVIVAILASKAASTILFVFFYFKGGFPAPMFWGAICDGLIFLITFIFFRRAFESGGGPCVRP